MKRDGKPISCVPCEHCNGTGELWLAPVAPPLPRGDKGRTCSGCAQLFPTWEWCGHSMKSPYGETLWFCSPGCYVEVTGDKRPWDQRRPPEIPLVIISLFR